MQLLSMGRMATIAGSMLLSLTLSLSASAMQAGEGQGADQGVTKTKVVAKKSHAERHKSKEVSKAVPAQSQDYPSQDSSTQQSCGSSITQQECGCQSSGQRNFQSQFGPKAEVKSFFAKGEHIGDKMYYLNWNGAQWTGVRGEDMNISYVNARGSVLANTYLSGDLLHVNFSESVITCSTLSGHFQDVDFIGSNITNTIFDNVRFTKKHMHRSNFDGAHLDNVEFRNSKLKAVTWRGTHLKNVSFQCSKIKKPEAFMGAWVWNGMQYVPLDKKHVDYLAEDLKTCKKEMFNLTTWLSRY